MRILVSEVIGGAVRNQAALGCVDESGGTMAGGG